MKKFISIFLVLVMLLTMAPMNIIAANDASAFSDVEAADYYAQAAEALAQLDILAGYPNGTFGAEKSITRAEMAAVVCRMIDKEEESKKANDKSNFKDVEDDHWALGYINVASSEGIITGDGNGKFRPEDDVLYEEAIKMVVCALGYGDDVEVDSKDWSKGYLEVADEKGISDNLKGSKGKASTRGDVAVMSYNGLATDLSAPSASLKGGSYRGSQSVKLTTSTKDADIYYTLDGSEPTTKSLKYTKAVSISSDCTLKAIAVKNGVLTSDVMSVAYTIKRVSSGGGGSSRPSVSNCIVSFDLNYEGATGTPAAQTVTSGNMAAQPANPIRNGYIFLGWSTSHTNEIIYDFNSPVTTSITLYALWANESSDNTYNVTFVLNDGSTGAYKMQQVVSGEHAIKPENPERNLYSFTGWYTEEETINEFDFNTSITTDTILYAGWGSPVSDTELYAANSGGGTSYSITGIEMTDNEVSVTVNTNEASVLVVKFLDETTEEILTTVSAQTPSYCELVPIVIPVEYALPEHYIIIADLYDDNSEKRCNSYRSIKQTSDYEEFDEQTVNDFEADRVISFDGSESDNFGVLSSNVKCITASDSVNKLTVENNFIVLNDTNNAQTDAKKRYVFENVDESISALAVGDCIYINGTNYLFKIGTKEIINDKVIFTESEDVELNEFYDVLKVDMEVNTEDPYEAQLLWDAVNDDMSFTIGGNIYWTPNDWLTVTGGMSCTGTIHVEITYDPHIFAEDYFYIEVSSSIEANVNLGIEASTDNEDVDEHKIELAEIDVPTGIPGLQIEIEASVPLQIEASAGIYFNYTTSIETGFSYSSCDGRQNIDEKQSTIGITAEGKASARFGPLLEIEIEFLNDVFEAGINAGAGIEASAETSVGIQGTTADSVHDCTLCIAGTVNWYVEVYADATYEIIDDVLEGEIGRWYIVNMTGEFPVSPNFYFSAINNSDSMFKGSPKFGWGECPNEAYKTVIRVKDADGNEVTGANVSIHKQNGNLNKSGSSPLIEYLYKGKYTASANIDNKNVSKTINVSDEAQEVTLTANSDDGSVFGMVVDSETNAPIQGATILISKDGTIVATATSKNDGSYQIPLGDGTFNIETTKNGYLPFSEQVTISNAVTTYLQTTKLEPGDKNAKGGFGGRIVNSVNGEPVEGVTLKLRKGWNNTSGDVIETLSTDENGNFLYEIKKLFGTPIKLAVGNYTLTATKEGFSTTSRNIVVRPNTITGGQDFSMSPTLGDGKYRFVLRWAENPRDLDSHLVGPTANGGTFHTWFSAKRHYENGELIADLDLDDTTSYGPETTTIHQTANGKYYFYVHHWAGSGSIATTSAASVEVYKGNEKIATYNVPVNQGDGRYWNVFVLDTVAGTIIPTNTITDSPNTSISLSGTDTELSENDALNIIAADIANSSKE